MAFSLISIVYKVLLRDQAFAYHCFSFLDLKDSASLENFKMGGNTEYLE